MFLPCILFELEFFFISLTIFILLTETPPEIRKNKIYIWYAMETKIRKFKFPLFFLNKSWET